MKRITKQKEILEEALSSIRSFFNAQELHDTVKDEDISLATVYRFLKEEMQAGHLYTYTCDRRTIYSKGQQSHCHFIDEETGEVTHFTIDNIDFLKDKLPGTITSFQLEVTGRKK